MNRPQVLIVGAGAVGLTMGILLKKLNISCLIIEKSSKRSNETKAILLHSGSIEILEILLKEHD